MSFLKKSSFSSGEVDPALHDVTDIKSYYSGLSTAKNVTVGKNGRLLNDAGTWLNAQTESINSENQVYIPKYFKEGIVPHLFEFGVGYVKVHSLNQVKNQKYRGTAEPLSMTVEKVWLDNSASYSFQARGGVQPYVFTLDTPGVGTLVGNTYTAPATGNWGNSVTVTDALGATFSSVIAITTGFGATKLAYYGFCIPTSYTADDLAILSFDTIKHANNDVWVYVACKGKVLEAFLFTGNTIVRAAKVDPFALPLQYGVEVDYPRVTPVFAQTPTIEITTTMSTVLGWTTTPVQYGITFMTKAGLESTILPITSYKDSGAGTSTYLKLPTGTTILGMFIKNITSIQTQYASDIVALRVYRRPTVASGATNETNGWGLVGESTVNGTPLAPNASYSFGFTDYGQAADFTNAPPRVFASFPEITQNITIGGVVSTFYNCSGVSSYQNRLVLWDNNYLFLSRIDQPTYFLEDFPQTEATALNIKVGIQGDIYNFVEQNGMIVFSSEGAFYGGYDAPVSGVNPIITKRGRLIIDDEVDPIVTPYGVFFVDRSTNAIRTLEYDDNSKTMIAEDISLFNDHLFYLRKVKDWVFKEGENSHLEILMSDGKFVKLTYNKTERINAWTRHETDGVIDSISSYFDIPTGEAHVVYLVTRKNGPEMDTPVQLIEISSRRIKKTNETLRAFSSSSVENVDPSAAITVDLELDTGSMTWSDPLIYESASVTSTFVTNIGKTYIAWTADKSEKVYLLLTDAVLNNYAKFQPDRELPESLRTDGPFPISFEIHKCHTQVTGLQHLEGRYVSVVCDGAVVSSPLNDHDSSAPPYKLLVEAGGVLNLPKPSYQTIVGLPYVTDIQTLNLDMREGGDLINKKLTNKVHVQYARTRGSYVSGKFAENDGVKGMEFDDIWNRNDTVFKPLDEKTLRVTYSIYSDYELNGKIAIRQVDPVPMEVNSIILDVMSE